MHTDKLFRRNIIIAVPMLYILKYTQNWMLLSTKNSTIANCATASEAGTQYPQRTTILRLSAI